MAVVSYGQVIGGNNTTVVKSTGSAIPYPMTLNIDLALLGTAESRLQVSNILTQFREYILRDDYPPALS